MKTNDIRQKNEISPARRADPADVESIDAIVTAAYDGISGPAGKKRDWDRERSLYFPGARLIPTAMKAGGPPSHPPSVAASTSLAIFDKLARRTAPSAWSSLPFSASACSRRVADATRLAMGAGLS